MRSSTKAVELLKGGWPGAMTSQAVEVYEQHLEAFPADELEDAVNELIDTEQQLPSVAKIRELLAIRHLKLPEPHEAWIEAADIACGQHQGERHPEVEQAARAVGGYYSIRVTENESVTRAQFLRAYEEIRARTVRHWRPSMDALPPAP